MQVIIYNRVTGLDEESMVVVLSKRVCGWCKQTEHNQKMTSEPFGRYVDQTVSTR
jgi:hypothetical protein